jgi:long-subunit acyl-CoA synthetase (AMP-forming)
LSENDLGTYILNDIGTELRIDASVIGRYKNSLLSFQAKDIYLHPDPFSVQNGLLTPTMKTKRPQIKTYFKPQLEDMYSKLN